MQIADKLYRRNPREWKKAGVASREAALARLKNRNCAARPNSAACVKARRRRWRSAKPSTGDRVAALMFGLLTMIDAAFEHKDEFYILDSLNEQKLYNAARNMEIAIWKLGNDRNQAGELFLLSNELDPANRNLSFEREFGRHDRPARSDGEYRRRPQRPRHFAVSQSVVSTIFFCR